MLTLALFALSAVAFASCNENETESYTVTFYTDGGNTIAPQTVEKGEKAERPQTPTKKGYTFLGWYYEGEEWSFVGYPVTENIMLTARWREESYGYTFKEYADFCEITSCYLFENELTLPSKHNGKPVKRVGNEAFKGQKNLHGVVFSESIVEIGSAAFKDCISLEKVEFSSNLQGVYAQAFQGCTSLKNIHLPDSVTNFGNEVFLGCTSLTSIRIPFGVKSIPYYTFKGCASLKSVTMHDEINGICGEAFFGCEGLTEIVLPAPVAFIGEKAFYGCENLTKVILSSGLDSIGENSFDGCVKLTEIVLPDTMCKIGAEAFLRCPLTFVIIPDSVTQIGSHAFNCSIPLTIYCEAQIKPNGWSNSWWGGEWSSNTVTVYWYSENEPTQEGNYWRYENGVPIVWE